MNSSCKCIYLQFTYDSFWGFAATETFGEPDFSWRLRFFHMSLSGPGGCISKRVMSECHPAKAVLSETTTRVPGTWTKKWTRGIYLHGRLSSAVNHDRVIIWRRGRTLEHTPAWQSPCMRPESIKVLIPECEREVELMLSLQDTLTPSVRCMMFIYFLMSATLIINGVMLLNRRKCLLPQARSAITNELREFSSI